MDKVLWVDDLREPPKKDYIWVKSVNEAKRVIEDIERWGIDRLVLIDIDHDAGDYSGDGGDYIRLLDWLEIKGKPYTFHIHSMNVVGVSNMRAIINHNGWKEI